MKLLKSILKNEQLRFCLISWMGFLVESKILPWCLGHSSNHTSLPSVKCRGHEVWNRCFLGSSYCRWILILLEEKKNSYFFFKNLLKMSQSAAAHGCLLTVLHSSDLPVAWSESSYYFLTIFWRVFLLTTVYRTGPGVLEVLVIQLFGIFPRLS